MGITLICDNCGKPFKTFACYLKRPYKHRFCTKKCESAFKDYHNTRTEWKGGRISRTTGYRYIKVDGKDVGEHVLVAEKTLGRRLLGNEVVHHINGNKTDNRPENLMVMTNSEHVRLHGIQRRDTNPCKRCGKKREIHGRGLCGNCYHYALKKGELDKWELTSTRQRK